jgi:hypothetical protein
MTVIEPLFVADNEHGSYLAGTATNQRPRDA